VNFKNTIIILTSNIGSDVINKGDIGFEESDDMAVKEKDYAKMNTRIQDAIKEKFKPEFVNRLDNIVLFRHLEKEDLGKIVAIQLNSVQKRLEEKGITLSVSEKAKQALSDQGYDHIYGARPLKRLIQTKLLDPIAMKLIDKTIEESTIVDIDYDGKSFTFATRKQQELHAPIPNYQPIED